MNNFISNQLIRLTSNLNYYTLYPICLLCERWATRFLLGTLNFRFRFIAIHPYLISSYSFAMKFGSAYRRYFNCKITHEFLSIRIPKFMKQKDLKRLPYECLCYAWYKDSKQSCTCPVLSVVSEWIGIGTFESLVPYFFRWRLVQRVSVHELTEHVLCKMSSSQIIPRNCLRKCWCSTLMSRMSINNFWNISQMTKDYMGISRKMEQYRYNLEHLLSRVYWG